MKKVGVVISCCRLDGFVSVLFLLRAFAISSISKHDAYPFRVFGSLLLQDDLHYLFIFSFSEFFFLSWKEVPLPVQA